MFHVLQSAYKDTLPSQTSLNQALPQANTYTPLLLTRCKLIAHARKVIAGVYICLLHSWSFHLTNLIASADPMSQSVHVSKANVTVLDALTKHTQTRYMCHSLFITAHANRLQCACVTGSDTCGCTTSGKACDCA
jgi:hypothetical protein